jgi:hypothetical protein
MTFGKWIFIIKNQQISLSVLDIKIVGSNKIKIDMNSPVIVNQVTQLKVLKGKGTLCISRRCACTSV